MRKETTIIGWFSITVACFEFLAVLRNIGLALFIGVDRSSLTSVIQTGNLIILPFILAVMLLIAGISDLKGYFNSRIMSLIYSYGRFVTACISVVYIFTTSYQHFAPTLLIALYYVLPSLIYPTILLVYYLKNSKHKHQAVSGCKRNATVDVAPPNCTYEERIKYYSLSDLESVARSIDKKKFPDRHQLVVEKIEQSKKNGVNARDKSIL